MMQPLAYYHHSIGFGSHVLDLVMRGFIYRTISVATRGMGLAPLLVLTVVIVVIGFVWSNWRRSW